MRVCFFTDLHIHDEFTCKQTLDLLSQAIHNHKPDLLICLGDVFDCRTNLLEFGLKLRNGIERFGLPMHAVYGNHDGSNDSYGGEGLGWNDFQNIFGSAQTQFDFMGQHFVLLGDMEETSDWKGFAEENIKNNSIVCCHSSRLRSELNSFAEYGAKLVFNGHMHMSNKMNSDDGKCEQVTISSFRFGGMDGTPAGCAMVDFAENIYDLNWVLSELPNMHSSIVSPSNISVDLNWYHHDEDDFYLQQPAFAAGGKSFIGSFYQIECWQGDTLLWTQKNGGPIFHDLCELFLVSWKAKNYLLCSGTWVKRNGVYKSLRVLDADSGDLLYDVECVGVNARPSFENGIVYFVSQDRILTAFEITTGQTLWVWSCEVNQEGLLWRDNRYGGGWSVTPVMIGEKHLWVANFRGDLIGVDKTTGKITHQYLAVLPNDDHGVYAYTMGFAQKNILEFLSVNGEQCFDFGGIVVNDKTGHLQ